jgi:hypothetical protein
MAKTLKSAVKKTTAPAVVKEPKEPKSLEVTLPNGYKRTFEDESLANSFAKKFGGKVS